MFQPTHKLHLVTWQPSKKMDMFASMAIGNVSICCSLSRKIGHWHHWKVCLASSTHQIDQLSHRSGWIMCRKNLHIVILAKVWATCSCTVLHKGSFKHWWWHSLQRSWHRLVDLVTDMSRHLSLIPLICRDNPRRRQRCTMHIVHVQRLKCVSTEKQFQKPDNLQREAMHDKLCHVGIADC